MKRLLFALALAGLVFGSGCKSPEDRLAGHAEELTEIMEDHMDKPKEGIEELREYMQDNLPDIAEDMTQVLVDLDEEEGDDRSKHADEVVETLEKPIEKLVKTAMEFAGKVDEDDDAKKELKEMQKGYSGVAEVFEKFSEKVEGK